MAGRVEISGVSKTFQLPTGPLKVLEGIDLTVSDGEFVCVVGASGCGKSTLLRIICGLERVDAGTVSVDGAKVTGPGTDRGLVFQESRLFPWLTVEENVAFGISEERRRAMDRPEVRELVGRYLGLVGLADFAHALPKQLSGGMQQRVSIARSLIENPSVLLLDEPFGALDALTRIRMQQEALRIWKAEKTTMILVTHDIDEAIYLGDRVVVLSSRPGRVRRVVDVGLPRPRDRNSEDFVRLRQEIFGEFFEERRAKEPEYVI